MSLNKQEFTTVGRDMLGRANAGETLTISKVVIGSGRAGAASDLWPLTQLLNHELDVSISQKIDQGGGVLLLDCSFNSSAASAAFDLCEVGVMAHIGTEADRLYSVANVLATGADHVDPAVESIHAFKIKVVIDRATDVTVTIGDSTDIMAENLGADTIGPGWFSDKLANTLRFKRAVEGEGIELLEEPETIEIGQYKAEGDPGRNLFHNPWIEFNQRFIGLSITPVTTNNSFAADRWRSANSGPNTFSALQTALNDTDRQQLGHERAAFAHYTTFTGTATGSTYVEQRIENVRRLAGKSVTVSFYGRADVAGTRLGVSGTQFFGTGGTPSPPVFVVGEVVTLTTTWQRYHLTLNFDSIIGKVFGDTVPVNNYQSVMFYFSAGSDSQSNVGVQSGRVGLWGLQLEVGTRMSLLEQSDPQQDIAKCYRFYFTSMRVRPLLSGGPTVGPVGFNGWLSTLVDLPVVMRDFPVVTLAFAGLGTEGHGQIVQSIAESGFYVIATNPAPAGTVTSFNFRADAETTLFGNPLELPGPPPFLDPDL